MAASCWLGKKYSDDFPGTVQSSGYPSLSGRVFAPCKCTTVRTAGLSASAPWIVWSIGRKCSLGRAFTHSTSNGSPERVSNVGPGVEEPKLQNLVGGRSR